MFALPIMVFVTFNYPSPPLKKTGCSRIASATTHNLNQLFKKTQNQQTVCAWRKPSGPTHLFLFEMRLQAALTMYITVKITSEKERESFVTC